MKEEAFDNYIRYAASILMHFQFIECLLRQILPELYDIINKSTPDTISYKWSPKKLDKASLGKLVDYLEQVYCGDKALIKALRRVVPERNRIAHTVMLKHLNMGSDLESVSEVLDEVNTTSNHIRQELDAIILKQ